MANRRLNDKLAALGITQVDNLVQGLSLTGDSNTSSQDIDLPNGFVVQTVADFCEFTKSGSTPRRTEAAFWENGRIPWLKSGEVDNNVSVRTEEMITEEALSKSSTKLLPAGTVLMAMYGVTAGKVGFLSIEACTNQAICGMFCRDAASAAFLYFYLLRDQDKISRLANGGAQNNLSKELIDGTLLVVPSIEQIEASGLDAILDLISHNYREIDLLSQTREELLGSLGS